MIHYYHPAMLPRDHILPTSADANTTIVNTEHELIFNEQKNARLAKRVMGELGGIPSMLADFDTNSVPEEKSMVGCVAYLCSRLIESSAEIQATLIIQHAFRSWWGLKVRTEKYGCTGNTSNVAAANIAASFARRSFSSSKRLRPSRYGSSGRSTAPC